MTRFILAFATLFIWLSPASAQTITASGFRIEWQVVNRFRFFRDPVFFRQHENAWRQYLLHVDGQDLGPEERDRLVARTSVLGSEHVLNDRHIAFTQILRKNFDWRGWASKSEGATCYDPEKRRHLACGGIDKYVTPDSHGVELWLTSLGSGPVPANLTCVWSINGAEVAKAPCKERVSGGSIALPYPTGGEISVGVEGERPIIVSAKVRDLLIAAMGDSFASGEGNPDVPVEFDDQRRFKNLYPLRKDNHAGGSARWTDTLCHRSLYGQHLRAALQIGIENRQAAVTFLDYSCSGASIEDGILGPQDYVEREGLTSSPKPGARPLSGDSGDGQLNRLLREICLEKPEKKNGLLTCPGGKYRRPIDFLFLSVGGNDVGFSNIAAWATIRDGTSASLAKFFGATVSADEFGQAMRDVLPQSYAKLAKALEAALPIRSAADEVFDPTRVILSAYPDLVTNERGELCEAGEGDEEDRYPANQSLDMFSSWLSGRPKRLAEARQQFAALNRHMRDLSGDHGWTFAGRAAEDSMFDGHGFCAQDQKRREEATETLMIPCWGDAERPTQTCEQSWSGEVKTWRPYNPATQNYPYALRQRWVRSFNDAYLVLNQKVMGRAGKIDEQSSAGIFSETTGALHPTAEGHAAMADALLLDIRPMIATILEPESVY